MKRVFLFFLCAFNFPLVAAQIEWVSQFTEEGPALRSSMNPKIDFTGNHVIFESRLTGVSAYKNKLRNVYLWSSETRKIRKISSERIECSSVDPVISSDGKIILYATYPLSVVMGNSPAATDFYAYDHFWKTASIQTFGPTGEAPDGESLEPALSTDGRYMVFSSNNRHAHGTVFPGLQNGITRQIYFFDRQTRDLQLISRSNNGTPGNRPSGDPRLSANAKIISFRSAATNLTRLFPLESLAQHLFRFDRTSGEMVQLDHFAFGFDEKKWILGRYAMDGNGMNYILELKPRDRNNPLRTFRESNLFILSVSSPSLVSLTEAVFPGLAHSPSLSFDGRYLSFILRKTNSELEHEEGDLYVMDIKEKNTRMVDVGPCYSAMLSGDGTMLLFESDEANVVPGVAGGVGNIFLISNPVFSDPINETTH